MKCCEILVRKVTTFYILGFCSLIFESIFSKNCELECSQGQFEYWVEKHWQDEKPMYNKIHNCIKYSQIKPWAPDIKAFYDQIVGKLVLFHNNQNTSMEDVINSRITKYNTRWDMKNASAKSSK
jgi:hypothetical protein